MQFPQICNHLKEIQFDRYEKDFTFIVNGKSYQTPRILADLISPKIRKFHFCDESINEFCLNTNKNIQNDHFQEFLKLCQGIQLQYDSAYHEEYSSYLYELGNIDEYIQLESKYMSSITTKNCISRLLSLYNYYDENSELFDRQQKNIREIISFISKHFSEISTEEMKEMPFDLIEEILSEKTLMITNEDSLLDFIISLYENDSKSSILFSKVAFSNVSSEMFERFISIFCIDDINTEIWFSLCSLFESNRQENQTKKEDRYLNKTQDNDYINEFKPVKGHEFEGIMRYLTNKTGGNLHLNGTIEITSNSIHYGGYHPCNAIDYNSDKFYSSLNDKDIYVCFDFKDKSVQLSSYSIKSYRDGVNYSNLKNWVIEVSNNGKSWEIIDWHSDDETLNGSNITAVFNVKKETNKFYRYVRLHQTGYSWFHVFGYYYMNFDLIEFFGKIKENEKTASNKWFNFW